MSYEQTVIDNTFGIIPIDKTLAPYDFDIELSGKIYKLYIDYNFIFDFFTVDLILNGVTLVKGEKMVLSQFLFRECMEDKSHNLNPNFPSELLYVGTEDTSIERVSYDNLGDSVQLYYLDRSALNE